MSKVSKKAQQTRFFRRIHKWISIVFVFFLVVIGVTAILLAWKKEWGLIPKTQSTKVENPSNWIPLEKMMEIGKDFARDSLHKSDLVDRVDVRPEKGIAKIVFKRHFTEIQVDGYSGEILSVSQRNSDLIEKIHDGSIFDFLMESDSEISKITYSTLTSVVLLLLCFTGFFLWYFPKMIKKFKNRPTS